MPVLLAHLVGDYLLQNSWMAVNKSKSSFVCLLHCLIHVACFALMTPAGPLALAVIGVTHFLLDCFSLAQRFWGPAINFGQPDDSPAWLSVWVGIIRDNTLHLLIAWYAIAWTSPVA